MDHVLLYTSHDDSSKQTGVYDRKDWASRGRANVIEIRDSGFERVQKQPEHRSGAGSALISAICSSVLSALLSEQYRSLQDGGDNGMLCIRAR